MTTDRMRGYTLLELIVSVGLFSLVMVIVMGVYLALISYDRQARATNQLVANLSFGLESMARNIRTGTGYSCSGGICTSFGFTDAQKSAVLYRLKTDGTLGRCTGAAAATAASCTDSVATALTDPRIEIEVLRFNVIGESNSAGDVITQPFVTITTQGAMTTDAGEEIDFAIQTTATQRVLDLP